MLRLTLIIVLFSCIIGKSVVMAHGQMDSVLLRAQDSLMTLLGKPQPDTLRVELLLELASIANEIRIKADSSNVDEVLKLVLQANQLANRIKFPRGQFNSLTSLASYYENELVDYPKARSYWVEAIAIAQENNFYFETHKGYNGILNFYFHLGDFTQAMKVCTDGLKLAESRIDIRRMAKYTSLFGFIHLRLGNTELSKKYYEQFLGHSRALNDSVMIAESYEYLADVFMAESDFDKALEYRHQSNRIYLTTSHSQVIDRRHRIPYNLAHIGLAHSKKGDHRTALTFCLKAIGLEAVFGINDYEMAGYLIIAGNIYSALNEFSKADSLLKRSLAVSSTIKHAENVRDAYLALSQLFTRQKKYDSALYYQILFSQLKDSIANERSRRDVGRILVEYEVEKKDREIAMGLQKARQQELISYGVGVAFMCILTIVYLAYNRYQLKQKNKFQQALNQKQNELFNTVTFIQDKERKRIAQDIHDQVGSVLSAAKLQLSGLEELKSQLSDDQKRKYGSAMLLMDRAAEELRNISHNLMPATLARLGLVAALRDLFEKISEYSQLTIRFNPHDFEQRLDETFEINIYPVVLELINNIVKHARATEVIIQLVKYPDYVNICVEDNGQGFDWKRAQTNGTGMGLRNLATRIEYLKGTLNIDSSQGKGTTVMIDIPTKS